MRFRKRLAIRPFWRPRNATSAAEWGVLRGCYFTMESAEYDFESVLPRRANNSQMDPQPKLMPVSPDAIPGALSKAERYRFLNEPWQAESICRDVLAIDPDNQPALILLV